MEEFLVEEIIKALKRIPQLKITIVLDYNRSIRVEKGKNSLDIIKRIITEVRYSVFIFIFLK